jgi:hypothetical protein
MLQVGFEPTIPAFWRAKTVHALDRAATVVGEIISTLLLFLLIFSRSSSHAQIIACFNLYAKILQEENC